jgi:hypothetical protein
VTAATAALNSSEVRGRSAGLGALGALAALGTLATSIGVGVPDATLGILPIPIVQIPVPEQVRPAWSV